jgi:hypothetical protein
VYLSSGSSTIAKVLKTNQDTKEISMVVFEPDDRYYWARN